MLSLLLLPLSIAILYGLVKEYRTRSAQAVSAADGRIVNAQRRQLRFTVLFVASFVTWATVRLTSIPAWINRGLLVIVIVAAIGIGLSSAAATRARIGLR
jgi:cell division protein FtsW (lipid II flippase)